MFSVLFGGESLLLLFISHHRLLRNLSLARLKMDLVVACDGLNGLDGNEVNRGDSLDRK